MATNVQSETDWKRRTLTNNEFSARYDYDNYFPWFWIDLETTGLDVETNLILEIVVVVTDNQLNEVDQLHITLHHPMSVLMARSSQWCRRKFCSTKHGGNGLFEDCHFSGISHQEAEFKLWNFFEYYSTSSIRPMPPNTTHDPTFFEKTRGSNGTFIGSYDVSACPFQTRGVHKKCMLAGSTVYFDRGFLLRYFPCLKTFLSHKTIDITTVLEMSRRWRPDVSRSLPRPNGTHRALDDIRDSINLMKFFKNLYLTPQD